jgi:hypothetical protein
MTSSVILSCIIIFCIVFVIYLFISFNLASTTLVSTKSLNVPNPPIPVTNQPNSTRSTVGVWIYVTTWSTSKEKEIFCLPGKYRVYLDSNSPILYVDIYTTVASATKKIAVTYNFPIQKWTYVTINLDNSFIDCYLDGKLIKSVQLESPQATNTDPNIYLGGGKTPVLNDIILNNLKRWTIPQTPQNIYDEYLRGNGNYFFSNSFSSYGLNINLLKDNIAAGTLKLF